MKNIKSFGLFLTLILIFFGWQLIEQVDVVSEFLGLPVFPKISVSDQYLIS